jgi:hypothetical protein
LFLWARRTFFLFEPAHARPAQVAAYPLSTPTDRPVPPVSAPPHSPSPAARRAPARARFLHAASTPLGPPPHRFPLKQSRRPLAEDFFLTPCAVRLIRPRPSTEHSSPSPRHPHQFPATGAPPPRQTPFAHHRRPPPPPPLSAPPSCFFPQFTTTTSPPGLSRAAVPSHPRRRPPERPHRSGPRKPFSQLGWAARAWPSWLFGRPRIAGHRAPWAVALVRFRPSTVRRFVIVFQLF